MSHDILLPFSEATRQTFKLLLDLDVMLDSEKPSVDVIENSDNIDIVIEFIGDLSGEILYRFPKNTTLEIVKMMSGMEFNEIDEFVTSAIGEIANIISGNAMTDMSKKEITCDILPPKIVKGNCSTSNNDNMSAFSTTVKTSIGDVELNCKIKQPV